MDGKAGLFRYALVEIATAALNVDAGFGGKLRNAFAFTTGQNRQSHVFRKADVVPLD